MIIAEAFIYELGKYTIRRKPLHLNPAFATHHIYYRGRLVGQQLSVPTVSDCEWYERRHGVYAHEYESHHHSGGYHVKTRIRIRGELSKNSKLRAEDVREIIATYKGEYGQQKRFAEKYKVNPKVISDILSGAGWKHIGGGTDVRVPILFLKKPITES